MCYGNSMKLNNLDKALDWFETCGPLSGGAPTSMCYFFCLSICLLQTIFQEPYII